MLGTSGAGAIMHRAALGAKLRGGRARRRPDRSRSARRNHSGWPKAWKRAQLNGPDQFQRLAIARRRRSGRVWVHSGRAGENDGQPPRQVCRPVGGPETTCSFGCSRGLFALALSQPRIDCTNAFRLHDRPPRAGYDLASGVSGGADSRHGRCGRRRRGTSTRSARMFDFLPPGQFRPAVDVRAGDALTTAAPTTSPSTPMATPHMSQPA
jgi:hypothetical protein